MAESWTTSFENSPSSSSSAGNGYDDIRDTRQSIRAIVMKEHEFDLTGLTTQGFHKNGSAVIYIQDSAPTTRADGSTAIVDGVLWYDTVNNLLKVYAGDDESADEDGWIAITNSSTVSAAGSGDLTLAASDGAVDITASQGLKIGHTTENSGVHLESDSAVLPSLTVNGNIDAGSNTVSAAVVVADNIRITPGTTGSEVGDIWIV